MLILFILSFQAFLFKSSVASPDKPLAKLCELTLKNFKVDRESFFLPREIVFIDAIPNQNVPRFDSVWHKDQYLGLPSKYFPFPARYQGPSDRADSGMFSVGINSSLEVNEGNFSTYLIPYRYVLKSRFGDARYLIDALKFFSQIKLQFIAGEKVRYRNPDTLEMEQGVFIGFENGKLKRNIVLGELGKRFLVRPAETFKSEQRTLSPKKKYRYPSHMTFDASEPSGLVRRFLNQAALISSHPEYLMASPETQVRILMNYVVEIVPWYKGLVYAENFGIQTYEDILVAGGSVCRHSVVLLAAVLDEAGFENQIIESIPKDLNGEGHAWVRLMLPATKDLLIVDPANRFMAYAEDAREMVNRYSAISIFFNPDQRIITPYK